MPLALQTGNPRIRPPRLRNPPGMVHMDATGLPLVIPEGVATCIPRKGGYPRTRGGLSLLPRIFRRHQHLPLGCQPRSPECSKYSQLPTIRSRRTPLWSDLSLPTRPTSHSDLLSCASPVHPRTILLYGRTFHNHLTDIEFVSPHESLPITYNYHYYMNSWIYIYLTIINNTSLSAKYQNTSVFFKNVHPTPRLPRVTTGGRHQ